MFSCGSAWSSGPLRDHLGLFLGGSHFYYFGVFAGRLPFFWSRGLDLNQRPGSASQTRRFSNMPQGHVCFCFAKNQSVPPGTRRSLPKT